MVSEAQKRAIKKYHMKNRSKIISRMKEYNKINEDKQKIQRANFYKENRQTIYEDCKEDILRKKRDRYNKHMNELIVGQYLLKYFLK